MWADLLSEEEQGFNTSPGSWAAGTNTVIALSSNDCVSTPSCLRLGNTSSSSANISVQTGAKVLPFALNGTDSNFEAFYFITSGVARSASIQVDWFSDIDGSTGSLIGTHVEVKQTSVGQWVLAKTVALAPAATLSAKMKITVGSVAGSASQEYHHIDECHLVREGVGPNRFLPLMLRYVPEYIVAADEDQANPDMPLTRFLDASTGIANDVLVDARGFWYQPLIESGTEFTTNSTLVTPAFVRESRLDWLAQLVGARRPTELNTGFTPWFTLETVTTWSSWESAFTTWDILEAYDPIILDTAGLFREFIISGASGLKAGTATGIKQAVKAMIKIVTGISDAQVQVDRHNITGNLWTLQVRTDQTEAPIDEALIISAAEMVKPAGTNIIYLAL